MYKKFLATATALVCLSTSGFAADVESSMGVYNFTACITDSKLGKQEQGNFDSIRNQMTSLLQDTENQLKDLTDKLNDRDFIDSLSPEGEQELRNKFQQLNDELARYQSQYYQILQQNQMRMIQNIKGLADKASEKVCKSKKLSLVINRDVLGYFAPKMDITNDIVKEMDKLFDAEMSKNAKPAAPADATPVPSTEGSK